MKFFSALIQLTAIAFVIYYGAIKTELTNKDLGSMIFWACLWLSEEIKQSKWEILETINPTEDEDINNDEN